MRPALEPSRWKRQRRRASDMWVRTMPRAHGVAPNLVKLRCGRHSGFLRCFGEDVGVSTVIRAPCAQDQTGSISVIAVMGNVRSTPAA